MGNYSVWNPYQEITYCTISRAFSPFLIAVLPPKEKKFVWRVLMHLIRLPRSKRNFAPLRIGVDAPEITNALIWRD